MNLQNMSPQQQSRTTRQALSPNDAAVGADGLLERTEEEQNDQAHLLETSAIAMRYSAALSALVESKHDQAERIEDRLENLVERESSRLQQLRSRQPGLIALPGSRSNWQRLLAQQQSTIQRVQRRLEQVRELKNGMGPHGPRIEEMASRKLRHREPGLAADWDELQEATRRRLVLERMKKVALRPQQSQERGDTLGLSNSLIIGIIP